MTKQLLFLLLLLVPVLNVAQDIERVKVKGKITAPKSEDVEGVSVYNISSQQGTITTVTGTFEIEVAENDRLAISALQFATFTVIVDRGVIENKKLGIYLNPVVNQLEEVIVRPYDLSGNVIVDVAKIKTSNVATSLDLSYETLEFEYEFSNDKYSSIKENKAEEAYYNGQEQYGGNLIGMTALLVDLLIPKRKNRNFNIENSREESVILVNNLRQRFSDNYLYNTFQIEEENASHFIYFVEENGLNRELLKEENEILLLDLMMERSKEFKMLGGKN
tara:strand:+ start:8759 stop:9589 length:831 start_codon:yes stop_codon:yes gene_type:complete